PPRATWCPSTPPFRSRIVRVNPSTAAARVIISELARLGVRRMVLAPGSRSAPLAYAAAAAAARSTIELHVRIDERAGAFTALGLDRKSTRLNPSHVKI